MKLPEYERVIYERNPLIEVIAQLKFPTILRISNQQPVDFQDNVRFEYPIFEVSRNLQIPIELSNILTQFSPNLSGDISYQFKSDDLKSQISLNKDSITFSTTKYERYEHFIERFKKVVKIFEEIYNPSLYLRIGLRYRDLIIRSKLSIQDKEWSELIPKNIASELHNNEISDSIQKFFKNLQLKTEFGQVNFNHGIVTVKDIEKGIDDTAYLLDADFFTEDKVEKGDNIWIILKKSNYTARNLFRNC